MDFTPPPTEGVVIVEQAPVLPYLSEQLVVDSIGHNFFESSPPSPDCQTRYIVQDYLLDQTQLTQGGAQMADLIEFDLTENGGYSYYLRATRGKKFHLRLPEGVSAVNFTAYLGRKWVGQSQDVFVPSSPSIIYQSLSGVDPEITYRNFGITKDSNSAILFTVYGRVGGGDCSFNQIRFSASYPPRELDPGVKSYKPLSYADPLGPLSTGQSTTFVMFSYETEKPTDPGRFITIE